jgi:hypothetical protein
MECSRRLFAMAVAVLATLIVIPSAEATTITHAFSVTATEGPLQGVTAVGTFTYDSSSVLPGGGTFSTEVFTALNFTWDGITYNEDTAHPAILQWDQSGVLIGALFGSSCIEAQCRFFQKDWAVSLPSQPWNPGIRTFFYTTTTGGTVGFYRGDLNLLTQVPESSTLFLLSIGAVLGSIMTGRNLLSGAQRTERHNQPAR